MNSGKAIKVALAMRGMKQRELAQELGVSFIQVNKLCANKTATLTTLDKIAKVMKMKLSELVALGE